jgi:hypothetical protein
MTAAVIDQVVRTFLNPPLKTSEFTRKGRVWNRSRGNLVDVVEVQPSKWNKPGDQSFTVNLGVFVPSVFWTVWHREPPRFVNEVDCIVRRRLSDGLADASESRPKERWWTIHAPIDASRVGTEVADLLQSIGIPFLDRIDSLRAVHDVLESDATSQAETPLARIYLAGVKAALGDLEGAQKALIEVSATAPDAWRQNISAVAKRLSRKSE